MEITTLVDKNNTGLVNDGRLYGRVAYKMYDKEGHIVSEGETHNNIVLGIRTPIIDLLAGYQALSLTTELNKLPFVRQIRLGRDYRATTSTDTNLYDEINGSENTVTSDPKKDEGPCVTFAFMYDPTSAIDGQLIKEMGLYAVSQDGTTSTMIARTVVGDADGGWKKLNGLYFEIYWTIGYQSSTASA